MFDSAAAGIRKWLIELFVTAIRQARHPEDRHAAIRWLLRSRDILAGDLPPPGRPKALDELTKAHPALSALAAGVAETVKEYRTADVPWAVKIAIPAALLATPAVDLPVPLLVYLGAAGITAIIEGVVANPHSAAGIALVAARILRAEASRRAAKWVADAMVDDPVAPCAAAVPKEEEALRAALLAMDPCRFEEHVMTFFERAGLEAVVTPRAKDRGLDGYAHHPQGLIVVQCKRHGLENKVGGPAIQQFRTVMSDAVAWRGYVVTTSCFTAGAVSEAMKDKGRLILVDMDALVRWHTGGFAIAE